jgi:hypothetical protein
MVLVRASDFITTLTSPCEPPVLPFAAVVSHFSDEESESDHLRQLVCNLRSCYAQFGS